MADITKGLDKGSGHWGRDMAVGAAANVAFTAAWPYLPAGLRGVLKVLGLVGWAIIAYLVVSIVFFDSTPKCGSVEFDMTTYEASGFVVQGDHIIDTGSGTTDADGVFHDRIVCKI